MDFLITFLKTYAFAYFFGGITFIPLILVLIFIYSWITLPTVRPKDTTPTVSDETSWEDASWSCALDTSTATGVGVYKTGWIRVIREVEDTLGTEGNIENTEGSSTNVHQMGGNVAPGTSVPKKQKRRPVLFFAVLKHGNLFLYDKENRLDVKCVIVLAHYHVSIWPKNVSDGELFIRKHAICLSRDYEILDEQQKTVHLKNTFLIFNANPSDQEDWYFSLIQASRSLDKKCEKREDPSIFAVPLTFDPKHMSSLIHTIHSTDAQLQTRWLNALLGRLFLGLYRTRLSEAFIIEKIKKKISRIKKPAFLSDIVVKRVDIGDSIPYITNPRLRDLSSDGQLNIDAMVTYNGNFRVEITTSVALNLGNRFKSRQVELVLAVILKKFEGTLALIIKPPPSNRMWYGFYEMPKMDMTIEPIVFSKQITYSMILKVIENKIRETIHSTLVFPYMEDFEFYSTEDEIFRGGIWDHSKVDMDMTKKDHMESQKQENIDEILPETSNEPKEELVNTSKTISITSESDASNKSKHSILLTTLRSAGSELKKNPIKRSSSMNTITNNSGITVEDRPNADVTSGDKSFKELCSKSFVTAAAISAFGKTTGLPKTLNKLSHSKIFKSEDINKLDMSLDKKHTDIENESVTSSNSTNSLKSTFATKKERLSAAFATMRESGIFDNKRKSFESSEKNSLSLSVSSATNTVRRWGSNYISKRHTNPSTSPESLNFIPSRTSALNFENNKKLSLHNLSKPPEYSEISTGSPIYSPLQSDEPLDVNLEDTVPILSHRHSVPTPIPSMTKQSYIMHKSFSQEPNLNYSTLLSKQKLSPLSSVENNLSIPPALPSRNNIIITQHFDFSKSIKTSKDIVADENDMDDQNNIKENSFEDQFDSEYDLKDNDGSPQTIESQDLIRLDNMIRKENTVSTDIEKLDDTVVLKDVSEFDDTLTQENITEPVMTDDTVVMTNDTVVMTDDAVVLKDISEFDVTSKYDDTSQLKSLNEFEYDHDSHLMAFYSQLKKQSEANQSETMFDKKV